MLALRKLVLTQLPGLNPGLDPTGKSAPRLMSSARFVRDTTLTSTGPVSGAGATSMHEAMVSWSQYQQNTLVKSTKSRSRPGNGAMVLRSCTPYVLSTPAVHALLSTSTGLSKFGRPLVR